MEHQLRSTQRPAEEDEGPVCREQERCDAGGCECGVDAKKAMNEANEKDPTREEEPPGGLKAQGGQCACRPVSPASGVDVDGQGPVTACDHDGRHRSCAGCLERSPAIGRERDGMMRQRIGRHPPPCHLTDDAHVGDPQTAQEHEEQQDRGED